jgi:hypothetical protein
MEGNGSRDLTKIEAILCQKSMRMWIYETLILILVLRQVKMLHCFTARDNALVSQKPSFLRQHFSYLRTLLQSKLVEMDIRDKRYKTGILIVANAILAQPSMALRQKISGRAK